MARPIQRCPGGLRRQRRRRFLLFSTGQSKQAPIQQFFQLEAVDSLLQTLPHLWDRQGHVFTPENDLAGRIYIVELRPWVWNTDPTR